MAPSVDANTPEVWPVMLTAFRDDRSIDWHAMDALIEWYIASGVSGLFAVCLSSEMYDLSDEERLALAGHVVKRSHGKLRVVASGTFGGSVREQAAFVRRMADTGVVAVVAITSNLATADEPDAIWRQRVEQLLELSAAVPLGLYECPVPYQRLISPELLRWVAGTGRFAFLKDTSCDIGKISQKCDAIRGTALRLYNANTPTLLDSLRVGCHGFSGISANFYPHLYVRLCSYAGSRPEEARTLQRFLSVGDMAIRHKYPLSAKRFLANLGLPIKPVCRVNCKAIVAEEDQVLRDLQEMARSIADSTSIGTLTSHA